MKEQSYKECFNRRVLCIVHWIKDTVERISCTVNKLVLLLIS